MAFDPRRKMNLGSQYSLGRWLRVIALGCLLGLCFVFLNFEIIGHLTRRGLSAPFGFSTVPVKQELTQVIGSQLADMRRGDYTAALAFADSRLRQQFGPESFESMVKTGYPEIPASQSADYGLILDNGTMAVVIVGVISRSGRLFHYEYLLRRERTGWKISGVTRVRPLQTEA